jgi:hypothetical protein
MQVYDYLQSLSAQKYEDKGAVHPWAGHKGPEVQ